MSRSIDGLTTVNASTLLVNNVQSNLTPFSNNIYDLGTTSNKWRNLYLSGTATLPNESLTSTTNQLILGSSNTTTINSIQPVSSQTINIIDSGQSSADVVLTQADQTINGNKTLSGTTNLSSLALTVSYPLQIDAGKNIITSKIDLPSQVVNDLPIANGGTNSHTALTNGNIMVSSGSKIVEGPSSTAPIFSGSVTTGGLGCTGVANINTTGSAVSTIGNSSSTTTNVRGAIIAVSAQSNLSLASSGVFNISGSNHIGLSAIGVSVSQPLHIDINSNFATGAIDLTADVSNILPIANGGTNSNTALTNGNLIISSSGKLVEGTSSSAPVFTGLITQKRYYIVSHNSVLQSANNGADTTCTFDTDDANSNWTTTRADNTKFIAPINGYYLINYQICWNQNSSGTRETHFNLSGSDYRYGMVYYIPSSDNASASNGTATIFMNANDYIQVHAYQTSGSGINISDVVTATWRASMITIHYLHE